MLSTLAGFLGKGLTAGQLNQRRPLWHPDLPLVVLWSQKSGCTTVVKWVLYQVGELAAAEAHGHWVHDYENEVFKARPDYLSGCYAALKAGRPVIKFVRDPASRAYSGYLELCNPRIRRSPLWANLRRQVLDHVTPGHAVDLETPFSFIDFVDWLEAVDLDRIDGHLRGQWLPYEAHLKVEALPIERLGEHFAALARRFDLKPVGDDMARIYHSGHHHAKVAGVSGAALEETLARAVPVSRRPDFKLPVVDTERLAGTGLGLRLSRIFARYYAIYPFYSPAPGFAGHHAPARWVPHGHPSLH